jgi:hypothetical protein
MHPLLQGARIPIGVPQVREILQNFPELKKGLKNTRSKNCLVFKLQPLRLT